MGIPVGLQPQALLVHPAALAKHLQNMVKNDPSLENLNFIDSHLLNLAHAEAIPSYVYRVWLFTSWKHLPNGHILSAALRDQTSAGIRKAGIKLVQHIFHKPSRKAPGWDRLGGSRGIKAILDELPLVQVRLFISAISQIGQESDREVFATFFDELMTLIEESNPWTTRSLSRHVGLLYARCSPTKVTEILSSGIPSSPTFTRDVSRLHSHLLRQIAIGVVKIPSNVRRHILETCTEMLLKSNEPYDPIHPTEIYSGNLPGLRFGVDLLLQIRAGEPDLRTSPNLMRQCTKLILSIAIRRRLQFASILPIINLSLEMCQAADSSDWLSQDLPKDVIKCWSIARFGRYGSTKPFHAAMKKSGATSPSQPRPVNQAELQSCLIENVLQVREDRLSTQSGQQEFTRQLSHLISDVHIDGRLEFLQLICRHSPSLNFDLTAWPPSEEEKKLVPIWENHLLSMLPGPSSKILFQRSLHIHNCDTFLPKNLVEQNSWLLSWEQQCSLWASWEFLTATTSDDFVVTRKALLEMKQQAICERDGAQRLSWARSAIKLAFDTKSVYIVCESIEWSKRFLRDQQVFPSILALIHAEAGKILACGPDIRSKKLASESVLRAELEKVNLTLKGLLENYLLLIREPWARMKSVTSCVGSLMFSKIIRLRIDAVKSYAIEGIATESELAEMMLDSLLPVIIDYEREGNTEDQAVFAWSGPSGLVSDIYYSDSPCQVSLSFIDRLQKARNELWKGLRARDNPEVLSLEPGWSRGLPIQSLATKSWLYHALQRPEEAPFLSSKAREILFSPGHIILASVPREVKTVGKFADNLGFIICAIIENGEQTHKVKWVTRIWEHYSSILEANTLQLEIFQDWLVGLLRSLHYNREVDLHEIINLVHPSVLPPPILLISKVPTGPEVTEWDPEEPLQDKMVAYYTPAIDTERPKEIPCIFLNYRMHRSKEFSDGVIRTREMKPKRMSNPVAIWLKHVSQFVTKDNNYSDNNQEAAILTALLFLDTLTPQSRLLQKSFPDSDYSRYGSTYLADEFITRVTKAEDQCPINKAIDALKWNTQNVSAQLLRDLICSFLDTLKALPSASNYPTILNGTLQLTEILLNSSQPQLVVGVAVRIWKDLVRDSSSHRKVSLVKIGRSLTPEQARHLMQSLVTYACETLQSQQTPSDSLGKPFIKVTTVKMLVQSLAEADFLAPFTRAQLLGSICDAANHIDIRVEIIKCLFTLISQNKAAGLFNVLVKISSSAAGPSERKATTDNDWRIAEAGGSLPSILGSQRPILDLLVSNAAREIPKELHSNYVQKIVLPLVMESVSQHARWMTLLLARLGLSLSDLALTDADIGPFSFDLVDKVLRNWARYLPRTYLQYHRSWGLAYLHRDSFNRITKALAACTDPTTNVSNVQDHWQELLNSQNSRLPFNYAYQFPSLLGGKEPNAITDEIFLEDFASRMEVLSRSPVEYNSTLRMFTVHPGSTLKILRGVRKARYELKNDLRSLYAFATNLMRSIFDTTENVRKEGWSPKLNIHPVTLPSKFEYEVEMLPSPSWKPESSRSALDEFVSCVIGLISKYAADPVLLMQIDVLTPIILEVRQEDRVACALLLGENLKDEHNPHVIVEDWVRVKLAVSLLQAAKKWNEPLEESALNMIEEWKGSNDAMVRQIAWEWDWKWEWSA